MNTRDNGASLAWRRSTRSQANGNCVEVATEATTVLVRDSKLVATTASYPVLSVAATDWAAFVGSVGAGDITA